MSVTVSLKVKKREELIVKKLLQNNIKADEMERKANKLQYKLQGLKFCRKDINKVKNMNDNNKMRKC
jgi:hypothetical protein